MPADAPAACPPPAQIQPAELAQASPDQSGTATHVSALEAIVAQQLALTQAHLALMQAQLELLRSAATSQATQPSIPMPAANAIVMPPANEPSAFEAPAVVTQAAAPAVSTQAAAPVAAHAVASQVPARPATAAIDAADVFTPRQASHFRAFVRRYTARTMRSKAHAADHRPFLADNRASADATLAIGDLTYPIVAGRSQGSRLWDVDGNEYIDFALGSGVHVFGHRPPFIVEAVERQLRRGFHLGPQSDLAGPAARLLCELTGMERATFCNTGSEAVMTALRIARAVTGRDRVVMFDGSYHGCFDGVLARRGDVCDGEPRSIPIGPGTPQRMVDEVVVLPYGVESLAWIAAHATDLAAVLVEPVQRANPAPPWAFLREIRSLTDRSGTVLVFDEVMNGLRLGLRGGQGLAGVEPDLAVYGKAIGGGFPIGVVAGRARLMDAIDGGQWSFGDDSFPAADQTFFAGTFCKHPIAMAAACAVLQHVREQGPALYERVNVRTDRLVAALRRAIADEHVRASTPSCGSAFRIRFDPRERFGDLLVYQMLDRGIHVPDGSACFLSTAHTDDDCDRFVAAFRDSIHDLQEGGFLPEKPRSAGVSPSDVQLTLA